MELQQQIGTIAPPPTDAERREADVSMSEKKATDVIICESCGGEMMLGLRLVRSAHVL